MADSDLIEFVDRSLSEETRAEFDRRVAEQAAELADALEEGRLDNPGFGLGIELELYAVDDGGELARLPRAVFEAPCNKELGVHNAELNTTPDPFDGDGLASQAEKLRRNLRETRRAARREGRELVLDAMWSVPPAEGTRSYLGDVRERDGVTIAENMSPSPRYVAIDNDILDRTGGSVPVSVPGADHEFPSILCESLTSSIQPHLQVPDAANFPQYYNVALAIAGPVLAVTTNSPLAPVDLYDPADPYALLAETAHELRILVFEGSINDAWEKVRFPSRIESTGETVDALVDDHTCAPVLREWIDDGPRETFDERFWELDHKRGTYWRWVRAVAGGQPVGRGDERSLRIEFRPIPTQPTVADNVAVLALVAGAIRGLVAADHPVDSLPQDAAEGSFYSAVADGLDAELAWIDADGEPTTDSDVVYEELFAFARRGLREQGVSEGVIEEYVAPLESRWESRTSPSRWKLERVREGLDDGEDLETAVRGMAAEYVDRVTAETPFAEWT